MLPAMVTPVITRCVAPFGFLALVSRQSSISGQPVKQKVKQKICNHSNIRYLFYGYPSAWHYC